MEARREELERKRAKLAALKAAREERRASLAKGPAPSPSEGGGSLGRAGLAGQGPPRTKSASATRQDLDDLVSSLVGTSAATPSLGLPATRPSTSTLPGPTALSATASAEPGPAHVKSRAKVLGPASSKSSHAVSPAQPTSPTSALPDFSRSNENAPIKPDPNVLVSSTPLSPRILSAAQFNLIDVPPTKKVPILYDKEVQTMDLAPARDPDPPPLSDTASQSQVSVHSIEKVKHPPNHDSAGLVTSEAPAPLPELTDQDMSNILCSSHFQDFFEHSTKLVERVLADRHDYLKDYRLDDKADASDDSGSSMKATRSFSHAQWTQHRTVTDTNWSPKFPELLLSSYSKNPSSVNEPHGIVAVWNLYLEARPEFVFHAQSDVLTASFVPFQPHLIVGGTYSGQILVWDTRAHAQPVLKTPASASGHTHPVYSHAIVGTQSAHQLITASMDGRVCSWQLDMLAQPLETLDLSHPTHPVSDQVALTCLDFPGNDATSFWLGTAGGTVYQANRHDRGGSMAGLQSLDSYVGHDGLVTSLDFHPSTGPVDFSDLFLTGGMDWTAKLWRNRPAGKPSTAPTRVEPLASFSQVTDYVMDVQWSPAHPAVFATCDAAGLVALWNLNAADPQVPQRAAADPQARGANALAWDREGRALAAGSSRGVTTVYDVGCPELTHPAADEWTKLTASLGSLSNDNTL